jgi:hypothetical protein
LSAEAIVQWLRAADAMGVVIDLESDLNAEREQNALDLVAMIQGIESSLADMDLSPFAKSLKDIRNAFNEQIKTAKKLGAKEKELAMIQAHATRQIKNAIAALEADLSSSITDLYGTGLESIENQISALQEQQSLQDQIAQANYQRYQAEIAAIQSLMGFVDSLFLDPALTTLNPLQQLAEAQAQFDELFSLAQAGDVDAINALPALVNTLLGLGRDVFASSPDYTALFDSLTSQLSSLGIGVGSAGTAPVSTADPRLIELMQQQTQLQQELVNSERGQQALALAEQIRELASVTGESFVDLAARLGLPIERFITDLGVNLEDLTVETAIALADTARLLGTELGDLAESVGISLGELADSNSFLNDALENTIASLPEGIQDSLTELLTNVENAANSEEQERALQELETFAATLPEDQRDLLAPFFEQIDPTTDAQRQIDSMSVINDTNMLIKNEVEALKDANTTQLIELNESQQRATAGQIEFNQTMLAILDELRAAS